MSTVLTEPTPSPPEQDVPVETMADVLDRLGGISADRVLTRPAPGTATEADLLRLPEETQKICELIDGTLVMKAVGAPESAIAMWLVGRLAIFLQDQRTVLILGPDGHTRDFGDNVRMPAVAVFLRRKLPDGKLPQQQVCPVAPAWIVEVLSPGNTKREIEKKLRTDVLRLRRPAGMGCGPAKADCPRPRIGRRLHGSGRGRHAGCRRHSARLRALPPRVAGGS